MQDKKLESLSLDKILSKCNPEDGLEKDDQPLYIDLETESVKCRWCSLYLGIRQMASSLSCWMVRAVAQVVPTDRIAAAELSCTHSHGLCETEREDRFLQLLRTK